MQLRLLNQKKLLMRAIQSDCVFACEEYLFEPLLRGRRCILHVQQIGHTFADWPENLPWRPADFKAFQFLALDGVYDATQHCYHAFDMLQVNHMHLLNEPLLNRKIMLQQVIQGIEHIRMVDYVIHHGKDFFDQLRLHPQYSGMIAKQLESDYLAGVQSPNWIQMDFQSLPQSHPCLLTQSAVSTKPANIATT